MANTRNAHRSCTISAAVDEALFQDAIKSGLKMTQVLALAATHWVAMGGYETYIRNNIDGKKKEAK